VCVAVFSVFMMYCACCLLLEIKSGRARSKCGCVDLYVLGHVYHDGMLSFVIEICDINIQMLASKNIIS
jgi:hypothetical protein